MRISILCGALLLVVQGSAFAQAASPSGSDSSNFGFRGHFQFRTESAKNLKGVQDQDQTTQSFYRLRTYFDFRANDKVSLHLTPQAVKGFGANQTDGTRTSGSTTHEDVQFYESYLSYKINNKMMANLGRQELAYGDHLLIGSLGWANPGRSFDALKYKWSYGKGWFDVVFSKVSDNTTPTEDKDDAELALLYHSISLSKAVSTLDTYFIHYVDNGTASLEVNTFGFRVLGQISHFFYRTENSFQDGTKDALKEAYQYNIELGGKSQKYSGSLEYGVAGEDFRQLFPTAHKFLGYADIFGRRNIQNITLHTKAQVMKRLGLRLDYHVFSRVNTDEPAYALNGSTGLGTAGDSEDLGTEIDLVADLSIDKNLKLQLGASQFSPGEYMEDQFGANDTDSTQFYYGQVKATF